MMPTTVTYSNGALQEVLIIGQEFIPRGEFQLKIDVKFGDELSKQVRVMYVVVTKKLTHSQQRHRTQRASS